MREMPLQRLELGYQDQIISQKVYYSENSTNNDCSLSRQLPILRVSLPLQSAVCEERTQHSFLNLDEEKHFEQQQEQKQQPQKKQSFWERLFNPD